MDYLIVAFLTLFTPFTLSMSDIDYTTGLGIKISNSTESGLFANKMSAEPISSGGSDSSVINAKHYGPYGVYFDLSIEYQIYPFLSKKNYLKNLWIAPKFSYEPLRDSALVLFQPPSSSRTSAKPIFFNQHPSFGFNIGYDLYQFKKGGEILSPYFGMQFSRVGFEGESDFDQQELFDSSIQYTLGLSYRMDQNWAANVEWSNLFIDARTVEDLGQDITLQVTRWKFGITYYLDDSIAQQKENKDITYSDILRSIDPALKHKIKEKKELEKAERKEIQEAEKASRKAEKERKKQEEAELKAAENQDESENAPSVQPEQPAPQQAQPQRSRLFERKEPESRGLFR